MNYQKWMMIFATVVIALGSANAGERDVISQETADKMEQCKNLLFSNQYKKAFPECRKAAAQGNPWAQAVVGLMYAQGKGVMENYAKAVKWYRKAAETGYAAAQNNLGVMYKMGTA